MKFFYYTFLFVFFYFQSLTKAQIVSISPPLDIRSSESFEIISVKENPMVLRSDKTDVITNIFDQNISSFLEKKISFERKNANIISTSYTDKGIVVLYSFSQRGKNIVNAIKIDESGNRADTMEIYSFEAWENTDFRYAVSEDRSKTILFRSHKNEAMDIILFDNTNFTSVYTMRLRFDNVRTENDFRRITLSNEGKAFLIFHKSSFGFKRQNNEFLIYSVDETGRNTGSKNIAIPFYFEHFRLTYDNQNHHVIIAGIYNRKFQKRSEGYFTFKLNSLLEIVYKSTNSFSKNLLGEYYKLSGLRERSYISDITIRDIILRNDGGYVLIFEKVEIFSRQNYSDPRMRHRYGLESTNYSYGELILVSVHENGEEFWNRIIKKNQVSSSDRGIYSSYGIFRSPGGIGIIFNDEIKDETQVIMHSVDPLGNINRSALFNTELYDLRLMPREAIQISGSKLVVPSLSKDKLKLLMLDF